MSDVRRLVRHLLFASVSALLTLVSSASYAEVDKFAMPTAQGMHMYWWPQVPPVKGWTQDREASVANSIFVLVRDGQSFENAPAVIYAKAVFKNRVPEFPTLARFAEDDKRATLGHFPGTRLRTLPPLATADGSPTMSVLFTPAVEGNWEQVCYLEEGEFYLLFVLSARGKVAFEGALEAYVSLVSRYKEVP